MLPAAVILALLIVLVATDGAAPPDGTAAK
jgi:hypothetical protein